MSPLAIPEPPRLVRAAATPVAGSALQNGTPTFLAYTTPNDGQLHHYLLVAFLNVTVAQTGGLIILAGTCLGQAANINPVFAGGAGAGVSRFSAGGVVDPNTAITVGQFTAMTAGAAQFAGALFVC